MEINSRTSYKNIIYSAVVVNENIDDDPAGLGRVQIYIPSEHLEFASSYLEYMDSENKQEHKGWEYFPWAVTLATNLKNGNTVYGSYVNNDIGEHIILGLSVNDTTNSALNSGLEFSGNISGILSLALPIILQNEVGISVNDWPDNISNSNYTRINPYDNGGWSIGLIQWHHCRAFDCLFQIAKADPNWENCWTDKTSDLFLDLRACVNKGSSSVYRNKYQSNFHPTEGSALYKGIQNMLGSEIGKTVQRTYAAEDTASSIETLMGAPYNIKNPAIIIFLADIMNQYGPNLPNTIKKAASISGGSGDTMSQLDEFRTWCKSNLGSYNTYITRRNRTYTYIEGLHNNGKLYNALGLLTDTNATDETKSNNTVSLLTWPTPGCQIITSKFGWRKLDGVDDYHKGIDLAKNGNAAGEKVIAALGGKVIYSYNDGKWHGGAGNCVAIQHSNNIVTKYFHLQKAVATTGATISAGTLIGYVGNTGNSRGAHLHFQLEDNEKPIDPLPYLEANVKIQKA